MLRALRRRQLTVVGYSSMDLQRAAGSLDAFAGAIIVLIFRDGDSGRFLVMWFCK